MKMCHYRSLFPSRCKQAAENRCARRAIAIFLVAATLVFLSPRATSADALTFARAGDDAVATLLDVYYAGQGHWRLCDNSACPRSNGDWGADSATNILYLRWSLTRDPKIRSVVAEVAAAGPQYPPPCPKQPCPWWSDTPSWDALTLTREFEILGGDAPQTLDRARTAFDYAAKSTAFIGGKCPEIPYQLPRPSRNDTKTLESGSNLTKAALLLFEATENRIYLDSAIRRYAADRQYFLDPQIPLYTVNLHDNGRECVQEPRDFFASVNGNMIWSGLRLWRITGEKHYFDEAVATARAVDTMLSDSRGIFADLGGPNDVAEPLVEAMYVLATDVKLSFAREWILRNAAAALSARAANGTFSRFFDGPPQEEASIWETNGGLALQVAAAALSPDQGSVSTETWAAAKPAPALEKAPIILSFNGSGIAFVGTIGEPWEAEHLRVFIDNVETVDRTGMWQNHDMPLSHTVRFAWRWPSPGEHTVRIEPPLSASGQSNDLHLHSVVLP